MAAAPKKTRRKTGTAGTVKLTIPTPDDIHARLVSYAAMSRPRKAPKDVVLAWIRAGLRDWHPGIPRSAADGPRLLCPAEPTAEIAAEPAA
jgi:hypothetical protein